MSDSKSVTPPSAPAVSETLARLRQTLNDIEYVAGTVHQTRVDRGEVAELERKLLIPLAEEAAVIFSELDLPRFFPLPEEREGLLRRRVVRPELRQKILAMHWRSTSYRSSGPDHHLHDYVLLTERGDLRYVQAWFEGTHGTTGPLRKKGETLYPTAETDPKFFYLRQPHLEWEWEELKGDAIAFPYEKLSEALTQAIQRGRTALEQEQQQVEARTARIETDLGRRR